MGFRSTFITEDNRLIIPKWFIKKWEKYVNISNFKSDSMIAHSKRNAMPLSSKVEGKTYFLWNELLPDIQKAMKEDLFYKDFEHPIILIWLHDCGGITKVKIYKDKIAYSEPTNWEKTSGVTHDDVDDCYKDK